MAAERPVTAAIDRLICRALCAVLCALKRHGF